MSLATTVRRLLRTTNDDKTDHDTTPTQALPTHRDVAAECLVFDLECVPAQGDQPARITKMGALRPGNGEELELDTGNRQQLNNALQRLDGMAAGATCVLGHNIVAHDLPLLRDVAPRLALHALPVIDTLLLSPLAFPQNPYHRLLKDYKLIRDSLNSPLRDCHSTLALFRDQHSAFTALQTTHPNELWVYQSLIATDTTPGLGAFLAALTQRAPLTGDDIKAPLTELLAETDQSLARDLKVCRSRLHALLDHDLQDTALHWPIAYALAWLRVSGGNSVLAPWVRHQFPQVERLLHELRNTPCDARDCQYCRTVHNPRHELEHYFGFSHFLPDKIDNGEDSSEAGTSEGDASKSLQHDIVLAGMQGHDVLAILPTGGGKSLCYQLPALNRYHRDASLTVIVSPLQSLMKDQVDGLQASGIQCAATLNGMLTLPERATVLDGIRLGDVGILLVSPEQCRNSTFANALKQRRVGAWIFDEAHCLSKWGHDFRPDYLYVSRFIRAYTGAAALAPIGCFTATAKPDVLNDIENHFHEQLGVAFSTFASSHERRNLAFDVLPCPGNEKWATAHGLLERQLGDGGAIVFAASRKRTEEAALFLQEQGWQCTHFHAGLTPNQKKDIQDDFIAGSIQVITATNAFGMGVDKPDVRLVIHADIPGSLENYLQEAGRAGRDRRDARCILLYDPDDIETQFGLCERARIGLRDIKQVLRKIRSDSKRLDNERLVITAGEILLDEATDISFDNDDRDAETKIFTAVAWLERGHFLSREENRTRIFPARLQLSEQQAQQRLDEADLAARTRAQYRAILKYLYHTDADERVNTDALMALTRMTAEEVANTLKQMEQLGLLANDTQLTLYVHHGVRNASRQRLDTCLQHERTLFAVLREQAPEADQGDWQDLNLSALTAAMKRAGGLTDLRPDQVLKLLRSLAADAAADDYRNSFDMRQMSRELVKLQLRGSVTWAQLERLGEKRRLLATRLLAFVLGKLPKGAQRKDLLVEATLGELRALIDDDTDLAARIPPQQRGRAIEHVLLYLHKQEVLTLNHGMTVMRRAMTIDVNTHNNAPFRKDDYASLDEHYGEKRIQVHVIREYAEMALANFDAARQLVADYFASHRDTFLGKYFSGRKQVLQLATSEASRERIVGALNTVQKRCVTDDRDRNRLVLAGPGSGKTRVIVHRIAYLLRVRRVQATRIVALAFNRHAANEIRSRLLALVGADAFGVSVLTYHRMAMRLTGTRFERRDEIDKNQLDDVMAQAVGLLEGGGEVRGDEDDDLRARLLRGYRYILVDEYQDIDAHQYRLVSALAGRHADEDGRLCIIAVGDDDQNIYAFRHTSNAYIERFQQDYAADITYLVDNYRSSAAIVAAANHVIAANPQRLKREHPIRVDHARRDAPAGGVWQQRDPERRGRVLHLTSNAEQSDNLQAQAAMHELQRLLALMPGEDSWHGCAVLAREHARLQPLQAWCEHHGIPYFLAAEGNNALPLTRHRSFVHTVEHLRTLGTTTTQDSSASLAAIDIDPDWHDFFAMALTQLAGEVGDCTLGGDYIAQWLYDYARELRQQPHPGLYLGTVHSAKGREFRHVVLLDGGWQHDADERRLYYVGMTRAQETLTLCTSGTAHPFVAGLPADVMQRTFAGRPQAELATRYQQLSLRDIDLGYPGRQPPAAPIHRALAQLTTGAPLQLRADGGRFMISDAQGRCVARTSKHFKPAFVPRQCRVAAVLTRFADDGEQAYRHRLQCERWQLAVPLLIG